MAVRDSKMLSSGKVRLILFRIFVIVLAVYVVFLLYSNLDLSRNFEYRYFEGINVSGSYVVYNDYIIKGAEPIFLPRGENAVLLLHGLGGTPVELKELAYYLASNNITVFVPLLPYQGRSYKQLEKLNMNEVYNATWDYVAILKKNYNQVYIGGLSTGGLLSLKIAENNDVSGVLSYGSPIIYGFDFLGDSTLDIFKVLNFITPNVRRIDYGLAQNESISDALPSFDRNPVGTILQDEYLTEEVKGNLSKITEPILIVQGKHDTRAAPNSGPFILNHVSSAKKGLLFLNNSGHIVTMDFDKQMVFEKSAEFIIGNNSN